MPSIPVRTYTRNPARFLLLPAGALLVLFSILLIVQACTMRIDLETVVEELCGAGIGTISGAALVWLATVRYTASRRIVTALLGFMGFVASTYSLQLDPPYGIFDTIAAITTLSVLTYVWMIALRCRPDLTPTSVTESASRSEHLGHTEAR